MTREDARIYVEMAGPDGKTLYSGWIDLIDIQNNEDIHGLINHWRNPEDDDELRELIEGAEPLVHDAEGIAKHFLDNHGCFDVDGCLECIEDIDTYSLEEDAVAAYMSYNHDWDRSHFEDSYCGDYSHAMNPMLEYAAQLFDECYLYDVPEFARDYIDYEKFSRDIEVDHWEENGHIFRSC